MTTLHSSQLPFTTSMSDSISLDISNPTTQSLVSKLPTSMDSIDNPIQSCRDGNEDVRLNIRQCNEDSSLHPSSDEFKSCAPKRRRSVLTLQQKLEVIERIKKGEKVSKLAVEYGVGKATVSDIKRQEDKITAFMLKMNLDSTQKRKTMRKPQDERVEKALYMWLTRERKKGNQVSGPLLMEKAKAFHKQLYGEDNDKFKASTGWLHRFKLRNGIRHQKVSKSKKTVLESETNSVQIHLDKLRSFIHDNCFTPEQIYTVDKTRLHWRALPFKTTASSVKLSRACVTLLGCVNATGSHKLRLALVGRPKYLGYFGNINLENMPFRFYSQENGWLDSETFCDWFHNEFVPCVRHCYKDTGLPARALLLVEDAPMPSDGMQLQSEDCNIHCMVVPSVTSFVTQPINSYLFETLKRTYRKKLILRALAVHPGKRLPSCLADLGKWVLLKDAGYMLSEAWSAVSVDTIRRLWRDTLYCLGAVDEQAVVVDELLKKADDHGPSYNCNTLGSLVEDAFEIAGLLKEYDKNVSEEDVANWLSMDIEDSNSQASMSDREIIESVRIELAGSETDEEFDFCNGSTRKSEGRVDSQTIHVPSDTEAYNCFSKCLSWLEGQPDCEPSHLQLLWKLQNMAAQKKKATKR